MIEWIILVYALDTGTLLWEQTHHYPTWDRCMADAHALQQKLSNISPACEPVITE